MSLSERSSAASKRPRVTIVGSHNATEQLRQLIETIAHSNSTALITGESGTGKELVAQALHTHGPRAGGPFVPINCGAIPRELIESELFGHRKGSFTGAFAHRVGRFELAQGGTLFLDEIGDLPLDMQVKLLRVLQERRILPVGADSEIPIDVRVVAATHKDLEAEVSAGRFREDLYYRINVLPIATTPLRERAQDVVDLLTHYATHHAQTSSNPVTFTERMLELLTTYDWPGNVRELSNLMDRLSTLFPGQCVDLETVPSFMLPSGLARLQTQQLGGAVVRGFKPAVSATPAATVAAETVSPVAAATAPPAAPVAHAGPPTPVWNAPQDDECVVEMLRDLSLLPLDEIPAPAPAPMAKAGHTAPRDPVPAQWVEPGQPSLFASNDEINPVEQAVLLAQGIQALPEEGLSLKDHLVNIERGLIQQALDRAKGNVSQTAKLLQLQRTTLIEKINKYGMR